MSDDYRFHVAAWAGRKIRGNPDMSKYHLVDNKKISVTFGGDIITACGRLACMSALIADDMDFGDSIDEFEADSIDQLERVTCRVCRKSSLFTEAQTLIESE